MKRLLTAFLLLIFAFSSAFAQDDLYQELTNTEMSIPSAPAFALLGVNPEIVLRPSDLKSFKVDWRIKNYNLAPDLALEAQPLWHLYYRKRSLEEFVNAGPLAQRLSSLSLSFGTAKIDGVNHAAYSLKMNLYAQNDPVSDRGLIARLATEEGDLLIELQKQIDELAAQYRESTGLEEKAAIERELEELKLRRKAITMETNDKYRAAIETYQQENWNRTMLDGAFGMVYTYDNAGQDGLKVQRAGMSFWLNGALKVGKHGLAGGIVRYTRVGGNANQLLGVSYRHGSPRFNFFVETAFENLGNYFDAEQEETFEEEENFAGNFVQDLGSGWLNFNNSGSRTQYTIAYGGDFRLSRNILLNFALRTQFSDKLTMERLLPVANVICLMK